MKFNTAACAYRSFMCLWRAKKKVTIRNDKSSVCLNFVRFFLSIFFGKKNNYTWDETTAVVGSNTAGVVGVGGC